MSTKGGGGRANLRSRAKFWAQGILRHPINRRKQANFVAWKLGELDRPYQPKGPLAAEARGEFYERLFENFVQNSLGKYPKSDFADHGPPNHVAPISDVKLIAYYLPQFHAIPENDEWWGKGFTEWRNVARAYPQFQGHYQPRVPGELGYYDLRVVDVMRRQVELAKHYGIGAFCFHFYWFGGKRLLELPIQNYLAATDINFPFCLCWANENWSRRWDGSENEVLMSQQHSAEDDVALLEYLDRYFKDERYLKIDGKPVLTVYRPSILPDAKATAERWRRVAQALGYPDLYLIATNSFGFTEHESIDFDALSEFPPHHMRAPNIQNQFQVSKFRTGGGIRSYKAVVESEKNRTYPQGVVHPGVMPSWDNSALRPGNGEIIHGATPSLFAEWLDLAFERTQTNPVGQRLIFINAWNEWAEGAYLEPDARFGYAYLRACSSVMTNYVDKKRQHIIAIPGERGRRPNGKKVLLCTHNAGKQVFGGERSLLDVLRALSESGFNVVVTVQEAVNEQYLQSLQRWAQEIRIFPYHQWSKNFETTHAAISKFIRLIDDVQPDLVYVNTIVIPAPLIAAKFRGIPSIVHARELILQDNDLAQQIGLDPASIVAQVLRTSGALVANSKATAVCFPSENTKLVSNVVDVRDFEVPRDLNTGTVRFGLISSNLRKKGIEDFLELARLCVDREPTAKFLIVGPTFRPHIQDYIKRGNYPANVEFVEYKSTPQEALQLVDVVVNFSHFQESFGRTVLEAMAASRPVIAYDWGALPELVVHGYSGALIPYRRPDLAVDWVSRFCRSHSDLLAFGDNAKQQALLAQPFDSFKDKIAAVCDETIGAKVPPVSYAVHRDARVQAHATTKIDIVVCVHNALDDVKKCLASVRMHLGKNHKIIIIDDGSAEETRHYLEAFASKEDRVLLWRSEIAGSYTRAANKGLELSQGELVILLNSDTIVTSNWAEKMADAVFSTKGAGIVGPLSNAASFQSLPGVLGTKTQTAVNELPKGMNPEDMNRLCEEWGSADALAVPLVHGFCFGVTREAIDTLGQFDEADFPEGYGEENDYCLRALGRGIWPVIATHTYVFHAKSKSYTEGRRHLLAERSQETLYKKYGRGLFHDAVEFLNEHPELRRLRALASRVYDSPEIAKATHAR